jgi:hypothetical protein
MNAVRRTVAVLGLAATVIVGSSIPAGAAFSDSVTVQPTVATVAVAAPASVTVAVTRCHPQFSEVTVSWPASTTARGVTGYRVTAYLNNGTTVLVGQTNATTRSLGATVSRTQLQLQPQVTVTTLTSYGWSTESARSAVISC